MYEIDEELQKKITKNFKRIVDKQDVTLINKELYYHLNLNCNFTAHFNLEGFRENYKGPDGFKEFLQFFKRNSPMNQWLDAPEISNSFKPLNNELVDYASTNESYYDLQ